MTRHTRRAVRLAFAALTLCLLAPEARAVWRAAGDVKTIERQTDGVVLTLTSGARVAVTFRDIETVRVRLAPSGTFERDFSYAVESKDRKTVAAKVTETRDEIRISSLNGTTIVIKRRPFLVSVLDAWGRAVVEADPARPASFDPDTGAVETSVNRVEWETYYGLGEKSGAGLSRDTQQFVMWNTDTYGYPRGLDPIYQSIGFYIALRHVKSPPALTAAGETFTRRRGYAYGLFLETPRAPTSTWGRPTPRA